MALDLKGAAQDLDSYTRRYAPIYAQPDMPECMRLLHRNPWLAPLIRKAIEAEMARHPERAIGLDVPLHRPMADGGQAGERTA